MNLTMIIILYIEDTNYSLKEPIQYETNNGRRLGNNLYLNLEQASLTDGYVSSVSFRLFTNWEGTASLYLFVLWRYLTLYEILHRYAIKPQRNTTQWQTLKIPSRTLPIDVGNALAVGMQDSSDTNQIYIVKSGFTVWGSHITENLTKPFVQGISDFGIAVSYSVVQYSKSVV
ncbi:unnamed protein product [Rotaria sp. Silwood1]|nr:unnamed protein product [Rotaria sp. Silwood1]